MKNPRPQKHHWWTLVVSLIASGAIALVCTVAVVSLNLTTVLNDASRTTTSSFTAIMDEYVRAFEQFEQLVKLKISTGASPAEIAAYLKSEEGTLAAIEGEDYDGIYLYYQGHYLYSWDTPLSEYEQNDYVATERPWYTGAKELHGDICFSTPYRSFANDYLLSTLSRMQPDGDTVIAYDIKLGSVHQFVDQLNVVPGSTVLVTDTDGNIIGSTGQVYDGGSLHEKEEQFAADLAEAQTVLESATDYEREKAQKALDRTVALKTLVDDHRDCLEAMEAAPGRLVWDFSSATAGLAQGNGRYNTITLIPLGGFIPMFLLFWGCLWVFFAACALFVVNVFLRRQATKETEVTTARLEKAVDAANAANAAKSRFLAQMSHEIRTPMNAIIGLTGIAKTAVRSPEQVMDCLTKIEDSSRLLLGIINDVLDMSAIDSNKLKIDSAPFNLRAMITNLTTMFYGQASKKGVHFDVHLNGITEEEVVGDELRLNQVLMNLLSNAVKFTPAGGKIDFTVQQASCSQGKVQMRFSVADTGCGISEDMLERLFTPFEQESASTARKHGGSGLGLSIAKRLVRMMGGTLGVQSTQGEGSVFAADIPFGVQEAAVKTPNTDFSSVRVLVVDDDEDSCEYIAVLLERLGVRQDYVTCGEAALEALDKAGNMGDPYTLCLIDWRMPGMNGGELTKQIRDSFDDDTCIIIISAYDLDEVESTGRDLGANYFIPKPLFQSTLFNALMHIANRDTAPLDVKKEADDYDFCGRHVLMAEDVELNRIVAVSLLERVGIEVSTAEDGRQAVDLFQKSERDTFDCLLLDINMPVMDGYEASRAIRALERPDARTVPIYAVTANAFAEDVTAALDAGMNGHIAKPIEVEVLYRTLEEAFKMIDTDRANDRGTESGE